MTSDCIGFSKCRIQFIPNDQQHDKRDYSDRSLIELRQYDFANYALRALDIENKREEIFAIPLKREDQYKCGRSDKSPDEIDTSAGTYHLWLNTDSRTKFHKILNTAIEEIKLVVDQVPETLDPVPVDPNPTRSPHRDDRNQKRSPERDGRNQKRSPERDDRNQKRSPERDDRNQKRSPHRDERDPPRPNLRDDRNQQGSPHRDERNPPKSTKQSDQNDIVADVYKLGQHIRRGRVDDAANFARKLSKQRVQLSSSLQKNVTEEEATQIRVVIDSNDKKISNKNDELIMNVYPSTTVAELRTAFQYSHKFPSSNQYFFVNGHLAYDKSTMEDLAVHPNTLFVLFVIQQ